MNTFGKKLTLTTFGESHGKALRLYTWTVFLQGLKIDEAFIQSELDQKETWEKVNLKPDVKKMISLKFFQVRLKA